MFAEFKGDRGTAVLVTGKAGNAADEARIGAYILEVPGAHRFWSYYLLSVISLRDLEGYPPATRVTPDAAYQLSIYALDPASPPDPADLSTFRLLTPRNVEVQFGAVGDDFAAHLCEQAVRAACHGYLPVEPLGVNDAQAAWEHSISETVRHRQEGRHGGHEHI